MIDISPIFKLFILVLAVESCTFLLFFAAPLQGVREWTIRNTPFLYSQRMDSHLLECKTCTSVWVSFCLTPTYLYMDEPAIAYLLLSVISYRLAGFFHLMYSWIRDMQIDIRVERGRKTRNGRD